MALKSENHGTITPGDESSKRRPSHQPQFPNYIASSRLSTCRKRYVACFLPLLANYPPPPPFTPQNDEDQGTFSFISIVRFAFPIRECACWSESGRWVSFPESGCGLLRERVEKFSYDAFWTESEDFWCTVLHLRYQSWQIDTKLLE
jgi:hypothetical protein